MKTEPENIPDHLFDWLENRSFHSLSEVEKTLVLHFFSKEEFEEMQSAAIAVKSPKAPQNKTSKSNLLDRFDAVHANGSENAKPAIFQMPVWRAAAIALLLICFGLAHRILNTTLSKPIGTAIKVDTVYLVKQIASAPEKIFDTIYISKTTATPKSKELVKSIAEIAKFKDKPVEIFSKNELAVVPLNELENKANQPKRNSLKDDSVLRKFAVVRL